MLQVLVTICVAAAAFAADAKTVAKAKPPAPQGASAQEDKAVEAAIRAKLEKSKIGKDGFTVRVQGGVAFWEGQTDVVQHTGEKDWRELRLEYTPARRERERRIV